MNLSASVASGDGCKSGGFADLTPHCAVCRCNGCRLSRCAPLVLFLNSGWQILRSFKPGGAQAVLSVGKPPSRAPQATHADEPAPRSLLEPHFLSQSGSPCLLCLLRRPGVAPLPVPHECWVWGLAHGPGRSSPVLPDNCVSPPCCPQTLLWKDCSFLCTQLSGAKAFLLGFLTEEPSKSFLNHHYHWLFSS